MSQGFIKLLILIVIAVVVLGYFNINLRGVWNSQPVQDNLNFFWESAGYIWRTYLRGPANFVWGVFYNYIWLAFVGNMERIKSTGETLPPEIIP